MMELTTAKGKSYRETMLELMMYYPTIFPTEEAAQQHLFLGYGTGFGWNKEGQLAYYLSEKKKRKPERTLDSIVGEMPHPDSYEAKMGHSNRQKYEDGKDYHFHGIGSHVPLWYHDISDAHSPIMFVLRGEVEPAEDWKQAINMFCYKVLEPDAKTYCTFLSAYAKLIYRADGKSWAERYVGHFLKLRKVCREVRFKWNPHLKLKGKAKKKHEDDVNKLANEILDEVLAERNAK